MKYLIHSNSATSKTGYGVQTALLAERLADDGHDVAISCNFGHQVGVREWPTPPTLAGGVVGVGVHSDTMSDRRA